MYKQTIDKKNKTITEEFGYKNLYRNKHTYTQKDVIKKVKKLCNNMINDKVKDVDEFCFILKHNLELLLEVLWINDRKIN